MPRRPRPRDWLATRLRAAADAVAPAPAAQPTAPATPFTGTDPAARWAGPAPVPGGPARPPDHWLPRGPGQPPDHWLRTVAAHAPGLLHDLVGPAADDPPGPPSAAGPWPASHPGVRGQSTPASAEPPPDAGAPTADRHPAHPPVAVPPPAPAPPTAPWGSSPVPSPVTGTHLPRSGGPTAATPTTGSAGHRVHPPMVHDPDPATAHPTTAHPVHQPPGHDPDPATAHDPDPAATARPSPQARPTGVATPPGPEWTARAGLGWLRRPGRRRTTPPRPPTTRPRPEPTTGAGAELATGAGPQPVTEIGPRSGTGRDPGWAAAPGAQASDPRGWAGHRPPSDVDRGTPLPGGGRYRTPDVPSPAPGRGWPDRPEPGRAAEAATSTGRRPVDGRRTDAVAAAGDAALGRPAGWGRPDPGRTGDPVTGGWRGGGTHPGPAGGATGRGTVTRRTTATRWPQDVPVPAGDPWPALPDDGPWRRPTGTARDDARDARLDAEQRGC
ncbi:hypothetical protein [Micromonospora humidisoli]|uniref:Uncharacterized protein n=1 Tax=Micromonospora humidisoli TaxID=2807622 RepID=A0ABS2JHS1_9ACTN|nr:hypothetical protein [Micromonospora humidisoli]MBM7085369.1 hypothetical protein [Micromonospora humidisoli]